MKAVAVSLAPLLAVTVAAASSDATRPQNVRQDVSRLVLLPGPYLTSPAKGAPQPKPVLTTTEGMVKIDAESTFVAEPVGSFRFIPGTTSVVSSAEKPKEFAPAKKPAPPVDPNSLRFDEKLPSTTPKKALPGETKPLTP